MEALTHLQLALARRLPPETFTALLATRQPEPTADSTSNTADADAPTKRVA